MSQSDRRRCLDVMTTTSTFRIPKATFSGVYGKALTACRDVLAAASVSLSDTAVVVSTTTVSPDDAVECAGTSTGPSPRRP